MKRIAGVAITAVILSVSLVAAATAHTVRYHSTVTFEVTENGNEPDTIEGTVSSDKPSCRANRLVNIFRDDEDGIDHRVTAIVTNADGEYSEPYIGGDVPANTYYAVAVRKVLDNKEAHTHVCRRAVSPEVVVPGGPPSP